MNVAILLTDMGAELDTIYAGMFCDAAKKGVMSLEQLKEQLPEAVSYTHLKQLGAVTE